MAGELANSWQEQSADMPPELFRRYGREVIDWITEYVAHPERYPVLSQLDPGDIGRSLPLSAPSHPEAMDDILSDFERVILPGITHWNHPGFFGYFGITASAPGMLAEFLAAALNVNAMLWRTSPAATELETRSLDWLRQMLGLPPAFEGVIYDTASISTLVAIAAALEATDLNIREQGMAGRDLPALRLYCSEHAHSSVEKGAITLGVGQANVRKISVDAAFRMDPEELKRAIDQDIQAGYKPFCVVATTGTTSTTSIDPVALLACICKEHRVWLHVDGAYGGMAAILPEFRWVLEGIEQADSLVVNPHKWLFTPVDLSAFYSCRLETVRSAFSLVPEYLRGGFDDEVRNYMDYGPQLGRRFRALKLWFILRSFGVSGIQSRLREHIRLAKRFAEWVEGSPSWTLMAPVPLSTVCFRAVAPRGTDEEGDALNARVMDAVNATGEVFLSHTKLHDRYTLRLAIGNLRTTEDHVGRAWELLQVALREDLAR